MAKTVAVYESYADAQAVLDELSQQGFDLNDTSIIAREQDAGDAASAHKADVSGIGPVIAEGPITELLSDGILNALMNLGFSDEDAQASAESVRRGCTLMLVQTGDDEAPQVASILNRPGMIDFQQQGREWKQSGWGGFDESAGPYESREAASEESQEEETIPIIEEELQVGKREVEKGRTQVNVRTTETPVQEQVSLREESVNVERRPADRPATEADFEAAKETSMEFKETAEEAVVKKQAKVVEEVAINKGTKQRTEEIEDRVRRTDVEVEEGLPSGAPTSRKRPSPSDKPARH